MIDIHTHILPNIDDGAKDMVEAIKILKLQEVEGVTDIVLTPHYNKGKFLSKKDYVFNTYNKLLQEVKKQNINIKLHLGQEISVGENIFDLIDKKEIYTIANTRYLLLELNNNNLRDIDSLIYEIKLLGYIPILAHLERYTKVYEKKHMLNNIIKEGVLIQVNADSILDKHNSVKKRFCKYLINNKLVSFIASDCHDAEKRKPNLSKCYNLIKYDYGKKYADEIFIENPIKLLKDEVVNYKFVEKDKFCDKLKFIFNRKCGEVF